MARILKHLIKEKSKLFNFKILPSELEIIQKKANEYYEGNVSGFLKYAALNYVPKRDELIEVKIKKN